MERLTFDGNFCDIAQCRELPCPHGGSCTQREVWEKLRAYEDTGLTPEEVNDAVVGAKLMAKSNWSRRLALRLRGCASWRKQIKPGVWWCCRARRETSFGHSTITRTSKFAVLL